MLRTAGLSGSLVLLSSCKDVFIAGHGFSEWVGVSLEILDWRGHFFPGMGGGGH